MFLFKRKKDDKKKEKGKNKSKLSLYKLPENFWLDEKKHFTATINPHSNDNKL